MAIPLYYNWRNLLRRRMSTLLTFVVVAAVVFVLAVLLSFAAGIRLSLAASGSPENLMVLKPGASAESTSFLLPEDVNKLVQTPAIARDADGGLLMSPELCVQTSIPRSTTGTPANVAVRGVDDVAFVVHDEVRMREGRCFQQGAMEVIVGKAAHDRYANLHIGGEVALGRLTNRIFKVVGVFEAAGGAIESEIWAPRTVLADSFLRRFVSSAVLRLADPQNPQEPTKYIAGPAVQLEAKTEPDYYKELTIQTRAIVALTTILIGIMAIGAAFAVANTMYAAVDSRCREIAMLRTLGFQRPAIMTAFLIESVLICLAACSAGLVACLSILSLYGTRKDFLSETTWTVLAYELKMTPDILLSAVVVSTLVGVVGAFAPALRASRTKILETLRKA
jgi:putative ABC transport system permease protein